MPNTRPQVLQLCHDYKQPFMYLSGQYGRLFANTDYQLTTVYLKGAPNADVVKHSYAHEVIFLNLSNAQVRGLKLRAIYKILKLHQQKKFAFCISQRFQSIYIATHIPGLLVLGVHHDFIEYLRLSHRLWVYMRQKNLRLLGVSNSVRDDMRQRLPYFPKEQIQTLYNSIEPSEIREQLLTREEARKTLQLSEHYWFVNIGRLHPNKDQATLIRAFAQVADELSNARLAILGAGELESALKELVKAENMEDRIFLLGNIPQSYRYLCAFDTFVLSSIREPFGMVLVEAMSAGLPLLVSDRHGIPEVVGNSALRFIPGDSSDLAEGLKTIYKWTPTQREKYKHLMYQRVVEHFSTESMRRQFWELPFFKSALP